MSAHEPAHKHHQSHPRQHALQAFLKDTAFVAVAFLVLNSFVLASFVVPTGSMEDEILPGDFLFVNKFIYGGTTPRYIPFTDIRIPWFRLPAFRDVQRGDVIVFEWPGYRDEVMSREFQFYLKRAMALSGDTVHIVNRVVYVNGRPAPIPRNIKFDQFQVWTGSEPDIFPPGSEYNRDNWGPMRVPARGDTLVLTPENFETWRIFIGREGHSAARTPDGGILVDGVPEARYVVRRNYVFGMGDHRTNSLDSRFWGYIPMDNVVGTPMIIYWSWNPDIPLYDVFRKLGSLRLSRLGTIVR